MTGEPLHGSGAPDPQGGTGEPVGHAPTYQGSRFPWWLALIWIAFLAFGAVYLTLYYLPDLKGWLLK